MSNQLSPTQQQLAQLLMQAQMQKPAGQGAAMGAPPVPPATPQPVPIPQVPPQAGGPSIAGQPPMAPATNPFAPGAPGAGHNMGAMGQPSLPTADAQAAAFRQAQMRAAALQQQGLGLSATGAMPNGNVNGQ